MKAVLFDAGGTLIHIDYVRVAQAIRTVLGTGPGPGDFVAAEYGAREAVEEAMALGSALTDRSRWGLYFRALLGSLALGEEYERIAPSVRAEHERRHLWSVAATGAAEALASLEGAGYMVACVSNADGTVEELLEQAGLRRLLRFVVDSGIVGVEKPDPRIFEIALERLAVDASETLYVGDIFPIDVVGARAAGIEPVLLDPLGRYGGRGCRTSPDVATLARQLVSARRAA